MAAEYRNFINFRLYSQDCLEEDLPGKVQVLPFLQ